MIDNFNQWIVEKTQKFWRHQASQNWSSPPDNAKSTACSGTWKAAWINQVISLCRMFILSNLRIKVQTQLKTSDFALFQDCQLIPYLSAFMKLWVPSRNLSGHRHQSNSPSPWEQGHYTCWVPQWRPSSGGVEKNVVSFNRITAYDKTRTVPAPAVPFILWV